jgi:raffinose/stachyose/melibiose transport system substrate-binding protein
MQAATFGGTVYGIPCNGIAPVVLYYNKKVLASAGLTPPQTYAQLMTDVSKLKAKGVTPIALAASDQWPTLMYMEYLVDRIGGSQVFNQIASGDAAAWTNPVVTKANQLLQSLYKSGAFGSDASSISYDNGTSTAMLYTGKAAMELMGTWEYANIEKADPGFISGGELGYTTFPVVAGGSGNPADVAGNLSNYLSVNAASTHKAAVMTFLRDYVLDSSQVDEYLAAGSVPPVNGLGPKLAALNSSQEPWLEYVYGLVQKAASFQLSWDQALPSAAGTPLLTNVDKSLLGQIAPASFGQNMSKVG